MEGNRDEAERCLNIAEKYIRSGYREKGLRLLEKSIRLYRLKRAEGII